MKLTPFFGVVRRLVQILVATVVQLQSTYTLQITYVIRYDIYVLINPRITYV